MGVGLLKLMQGYRYQYHDQSTAKIAFLYISLVSLSSLPPHPAATDAHRALQMLEEYRRNLTGPDTDELRAALTKAIVAIRSRLFQALLGELSPHFL